MSVAPLLKNYQPKQVQLFEPSSASLLLISSGLTKTLKDLFCLENKVVFFPPVYLQPQVCVLACVPDCMFFRPTA